METESRSEAVWYRGRENEKLLPAGYRVSVRGDGMILEIDSDDVDTTLQM